MMPAPNAMVKYQSHVPKDMVVKGANVDYQNRYVSTDAIYDPEHQHEKVEFVKRHRYGHTKPYNRRRQTCHRIDTSYEDMYYIEKV